MPATRAALYCRVSTSDQHADMQLAELREQAKHRGWEIVGEYVDEGVSGAKASRPQLDALMADARRRRFDVVAVWKFDRFARSTTHLLSALEEFQALGLNFLSLREAVDTSTPMGKMVFTVVGAVAELERSLIRERVVAGLERARRRGKRLGRPQAEVDVVRALDLKRQGKSLRQIAKALGVSRTTVMLALRAAKRTVRKSPSKSHS